MGRVFSLHYYRLQPAAKKKDLERAFRQAEQEGLFELPGLEQAHLLWGIKGERSNRAVALWIYRSRQEWEQLWGAPEDPVEPEDYPDRWTRWERELLDPLLAGDPDKIDLTSYEVLFSYLSSNSRDIE